MRVLITGVSGTLGQDMLRTRPEHIEILPTDRDQLDITDADAVMAFVREMQPDAIVNTAAYNLVDKVEDADVYPLAEAVNAYGPKYLAEAAKAADIPFVHISTDYVFAGDKPEGYMEEDAPRPISEYGKTKALGEELVEKVGGKVAICRTSKLFGIPGISGVSKESFVQLMLRLASERDQLSVDDEEVGCPTYSHDLALAIWELLADFQPGKYHFVNAGEGVTWYQFAKEIFDVAGVDIAIEVVPSSFFNKKAQRPKFAALQVTHGPRLPDRIDALKRFLSE